MLNVKVVTLENGKDYAILDQKEDYVFLVNTEDYKDLAVRKKVTKDGKELLETLESEQELDNALDLFHEQK